MHLILLTDQLGRVLETVVSRCQLVRFDPLPAERVAAALEAEGVPAGRAARARGWRSATPSAPASSPRPRARELRAEVDAFAAAALDGEPGEPWRALLARAEERRAEAEEASRPRPRSGWSSSRRAASGAPSSASSRRPPSATAAAPAPRCSTWAWGWPRSGSATWSAWPRGARRPCWRPDRAPALAERARGRDPRRLREAAERCEETRQSLLVNVSEELALSALGFRLAGLVGAPG